MDMPCQNTIETKAVQTDGNKCKFNKKKIEKEEKKERNSNAISFTSLLKVDL